MHRAVRSWLVQICCAVCTLFAINVAAQTLPTTANHAEQLYLKVSAAIAEGEIAYAQQLLEQLMQSQPEHAGAWLDAAMLWCQLGQSKKAFALWDEIELRFNPPLGIAEFIAAQRRQGCAFEEKKARWNIQAGRGYSNNINQGPSSLDLHIPTAGGPTRVQLLPEAAPRSDAFTQLELSVDNIALPSEWTGSVQTQLRRHDDSRDMDMQTLVAETYRAWQWKGWRGLHRYSLGAAFLDGSLYQRSLQFHLQARPPFPTPPAWRSYVSLTGSKVQYPSLQNFNADRWELASVTEHDSSVGLWQASITALYDAGAQLRPGGDKQGLATKIQWHRSLPSWQDKPIFFRAGLEWQRWDGQRIYAPGFIETRRSQRTLSSSLSLTMVCNSYTSWTIEARKISNKENISLFAYSAAQVQLSWRHNFKR